MASSSSLSPTERFYEKSIATGSFFRPEHYLAFCDNDVQAQRLVDCCTNLGLMTFLNPPISGICYENLIAFWKNAKVIPSGKKTESECIKSTIFGKEVVITIKLLNQHLHLPQIGTADVKSLEVDIKRFWDVIAKNPKKNNKTYNLARSALKLPFAEFAPVITKNIEGRKGSMENLTELRIKLMAIIYERINFDWASFVFNRLKDQVQKETDLCITAPRKGLQKKGDFWEKKSYGFPLQHLFDSLKIKPTNLQTPHRSKVMFTYLKASMKPQPAVGRKRKQPESSKSGMGRRTRSQKIPENKSTETYDLTSSKDSSDGEEAVEEGEHSAEDHFEAISETLGSSDDELTIQEVLLRSLTKIDRQPSETANQPHFTETVNPPTIDQGGKSDKEDKMEEKEAVALEEEDEKAEADNDDEKLDEEEEKKEEEERQEEEEKGDDDDDEEIREEEKEEEEGDKKEEQDESDNEDFNMPIPEFDLERCFNLDIQPLISHMEKQYSSRKHLKQVLQSEAASKDHKFKALYDHLKVQDAIIDHQSQLLCNLQFLVPHLVQTCIDFHADKIDHNLRPLVDTLNAHTSHMENLDEIMEQSSKDLNLLLKVGEATNKILERRYGPLPDAPTTDLEALFGDAKKGEESSGKKKPEESSQKGKEPASSSRKGKEASRCPTEKGKKDKGKGIWIEEPKK